MNTTTDKTLSVSSMQKAQEMKREQDIKDWAQYSQWIAAAMSKRMSELGLTQKMLAENGVELQLTEGALNFLSQVGYDPEFGARPVKRAIQRYLLNDLSKKLLSQEVDRSKAIIVDADGDGLVFRN